MSGLCAFYGEEMICTLCEREFSTEVIEAGTEIARYAAGSYFRLVMFQDGIVHSFRKISRRKAVKNKSGVFVRPPAEHNPERNTERVSSLGQIESFKEGT
jgi:hypothetical protein